MFQLKNQFVISGLTHVNSKTCHLCFILQKNNTRVVKIDGYEYVAQNDEKSLKKAVAHQPVGVAIEASSQAFKLYKSVIFNDPCHLKKA